MRNREDLTALGEGRQAEVYLRPDGNVLKLIRDPQNGWQVEREVIALTAVRANGPFAPAVIGTVTLDGRPGLIMERVPGSSLLATLSSRPWLARRVGRSMATLQLRIHDQPAPETLPDLHTQLRQRIESAASLPKHLAAFALSVLDGLPSGDRLCHGDFHVDNLIGTVRSPMAIDWTDASRGTPIADVARTVLLLRSGGLPPGASAALRVFVPVVRGVVVRRYLAVYRQGCPIDEDLLRRWLIVRVAARFVESIDLEYDWLVAHLTAAYQDSGEGATPA